MEKQLKIAEEKGFLAIDTETDSLLATQAEMVGFSFCFEEGKSFYVPLRHRPRNPQADLFGAQEEQEKSARFLWNRRWLC